MADDALRQDIAAAKSKMRVKIGAGREIKRLAGYLWEGEAVEQMTTGTYGKGTGLVVLTDRRLLFVQDGMMSKTTEDFPIDKVSSVQWTSGLVMGEIIIFASGNKSDIKNVNKDDGKEIGLSVGIRGWISCDRLVREAEVDRAAGEVDEPRGAQGSTER